MLRHDAAERNGAKPKGRSAICCAKAHRYNFPTQVCHRRPRGRQFHNAAYVPRAATNEIQTRSTIEQAWLRSSTLFAFRRSAFLTPTICSGIRQPNLVENAPNYCVHHCGYGTGAAVEGGNSWKNNRPGFKQRDHVARV